MQRNNNKNHKHNKKRNRKLHTFKICKSKNLTYEIKEVIKRELGKI